MRSGVSAFLTGMFLMVSAAHAEGELHIYNWRFSTNPKLIERFAQTYDVNVTLDEYESNQELLATLRAGNSGYDIVVPSDWAAQLLIEEGLLAETKPNQMSNFENVDPRWIDAFWDPERNYSVPNTWGTTGLVVDTATYSGEMITLELIFEPPPELEGRISVVSEGANVIRAALRYLNKPPCGNDPTDLEALTELLQSASRHWRSITYDNVDLMLSGDTVLSYTWNVQALIIRREKPAVKYVYPLEGVEGWMDNLVVPKDAPNPENAKLFQNFMMDPEIAAMNSDFNLTANAILGSEKLLPQDFTDAPEIKLPAGVVPEFAPPCPQDVRDKHEAIWAEVTK